MKDISARQRADLLNNGCTVLKSALPPTEIESLLCQVRALKYLKAAPVSPQQRAFQEFEYSFASSVAFAYGPFLNYFQGWLCDQFPEDLPSDFIFNRIFAQKYRTGQLGISRHVDGNSNKFMIANFCLSGSGRFVVYNGDVEVQVDVSPGNIVLMAANGFRDWRDTPFHAISDIVGDRYIFGLRHG